MEKSTINPHGRKQEIIEAAREVFSKYGYKKTTMDDVASSLNITRSALYYYYKNKDDIFLAVGEYMLLKYEIELKKAVSEAGTTDEKFTALCRCYLPSKKNFKNIFKLESDDYPFSFEIHKKFRELSNKIHVDIIAEILLEDPGIGKTRDLEYFSTLLAYSIRGVIFNSSDSPVELLERDILKLCEVFCHGLGTVSQDNKMITGKRLNKYE